MEGRTSFIKKGSILTASLFIVCLPFFQGCGGGGSDSDTGTKAEQSSQGRVIIGLTDAQGDFLHYQVNVTALKLYKANGAVVETLPLTTAVDFAQLTDMTEFLIANTIPSGTYAKAVLTLDYSNADIEVEGADGEPVKVAAANIRDEDGASITSAVEVSVSLEALSSLVIVPGVPKHLSLDFDLGATNKVTFTNGVPAVAVSPYLKADLSPRTDKIHRLRGPLQGVDVSGSSFTLILRPFAHALNVHDDRFGTMQVTVDSDTDYLIDGARYTGAAGLAAMNALGQYAGVIVHGDFAAGAGLRFVAREVYAGSCVPGGALDAVAGNVVSRTGAGDQPTTLVIRGATLYRSGGAMIFNDTVTVTVGARTKVYKQYTRDDEAKQYKQTFDKDDVSVGQRVLVFGALTDAHPDHLALDAANGFVKMLLTTLIGSVVEEPVMDEAQRFFAMDLQSIDGRKIALFDFSGTYDGTPDPVNDADPAHYTVDAGGLDQPSVGDSVRAKGFVKGVDPSNPLLPPDFEARTIINVTSAYGLMNVGWGLTGTVDAFSSISSEGLDLDLGNAGFFKRVNRGGVITELSGTPHVVPSGGFIRSYTICRGGRFSVHLSFASFQEALGDDIAGGSKVKHLYASGTFDDAAQTMTAQYILVTLD